MTVAVARAPLKLGPDGFRGIAIIGSAPSSIRLAPYDDPAWAIWGCSPGAYGVIPFGRTDAFFEMHRWEPPTAGNPTDQRNKGWFSPEYVQFLQQHRGPVYLASPDYTVENPVPAVINGWRFPFEDYIAKYGQFFFTSSMAWMLAHAIEHLAPRAAAGEQVMIGLWGVDMAAISEYNQQRPGCQHFLGLARKLGIQVILPPESDLMLPPRLYGISEYNIRAIKWLARDNELKGRQAFLQQQIAQMQSELVHINGCLDNMAYMLNTWADDLDPNCDITSAISLAGVTMSRPDPIEAAAHQFEKGPLDVAAAVQGKGIELQVGGLNPVDYKLQENDIAPAREAAARAIFGSKRYKLQENDIAPAREAAARAIFGSKRKAKRRAKR